MRLKEVKKQLQLSLAKKLYFFNKYYFLSFFDFTKKMIIKKYLDNKHVFHKFPLMFNYFISIELLFKNVKNYGFYGITFCALNFFYVTFLNNYLYLFSIVSSLRIFRAFFQSSQFLLFKE